MEAGIVLTGGRRTDPRPRRRDRRAHERADDGRDDPLWCVARGAGEILASPGCSNGFGRTQIG